MKDKILKIKINEKYSNWIFERSIHEKISIRNKNRKNW